MKSFFIILFLFTTLISKADFWTQKADFPAGGRFQPFSFSIGGKGYVGCGIDSVIYNCRKDFWEYDPVVNSWTQIADFGGNERCAGFSFSIGNKGYAGGGANLSIGVTQTQDFWEYDPLTNAWTQKANFGWGNRSQGISFSIGNKGYAGTGVDYSIGYFNDFWEYDPSTDAWTQMANVPGNPRQGSVGFSIGTKGYVSGGLDGLTSSFLFDLRQFNPVTNSWVTKSNFQGGGRCEHAAFSICDKGYVGMGEATVGTFWNDIFQYDPTLNHWIQKASFPGLNRDEIANFTINVKGYIGLGGGSGGWTHPYNDFWEYTPDSACPTAIKNLSSSDLSFEIFPTPFSNSLTITTNENKQFELIVFNVAAEKILQQKFLQSITINTEQLAKGIYFYELRNGNGSNKKVIKAGKVIKQ